MPMLAVTYSSRPPTDTGRRISSRIRLDANAASAGDLMSGRITVNSSPLSRATVSSARTHDRTLAASSFSTASPTSWPSESLTTLKSSTSRNSRATGPGVRRARMMAWLSRSMNSFRFGRPVRAS